MVASADRPLSERFQRLPGSPLRPKPMRARTKVRLEDGLQDQLGRHLDHSIPDRRNPQRPLLPVGFGNVPPPYRLRSVPTRAQLGSDLFQEAIHPILFDVGQRLGIDARRALVPLDSFPCFLQDVTPADAVV